MATSRWKPIIKKLLFWGGIAFIAMLLLVQLKQPQRTNPPVISEIMAPPEIQEILERSCYACHSFETEWPWYAYVMPMSWFVIDHVDEGRLDLNFSDWPVLDFEEIAHEMEEIAEEVESGEMPLKSYTLLHWDAKLSEEDREKLLEWARSGPMGAMPME